MWTRVVQREQEAVAVGGFPAPITHPRSCLNMLQLSTAFPTHQHTRVDISAITCDSISYNIPRVK